MRFQQASPKLRPEPENLAAVSYSSLLVNGLKHALTTCVGQTTRSYQTTGYYNRGFLASFSKTS